MKRLVLVPSAVVLSYWSVGVVMYFIDRARNWCGDPAFELIMLVWYAFLWPFRAAFDAPCLGP
jgi:hypothetical protein